MIRNLRIFAALVAAISAIFTVGASAAQADGGFVAGTYPVSLTGTPTTETTFSLNGVRTGSCQAAYHGVLTAASATLPITPEYAKCTWGTSPTTMALNECTYGWSLDERTGSTGSGSQTLNCPSGHQFEIRVYQTSSQQEENIPYCVYAIAPQKVGGLSYANVGSGSGTEVQASIQIQALKATRLVGGSLNCGAETTNVYFTSGVRLSGSVEGSQVELAASAGGVYLAGKESSEVSRQPRIESEFSPAPVSGSESVSAPFQLTLGSGVRTFYCSTATLSGEVPGSTTSLALAASYGGCTSTGGLSSLIRMNSCHFDVGVLNVGPPYAGSLGISCSKEGDAIEPVVLNGSKEEVCIYRIAPQSGLAGVGLETSGSGGGRGVTMNLNVSTISNTVVHGGKLLCGISGSSGKYTGSTTLTAY